MKVGLQGHGKPAVSEYYELERFINHALLEVRPITGRTHQIRVHLSYLGIPVAGDSLYGRRHSSIELDRFFLHASSIKIKLLGERVTRIFNVPLPVDLQAVVDHLRQYERKSS
jgi:23S rRNA pseudouridine1911/1915/1917 synthase